MSKAKKQNNKRPNGEGVGPTRSFDSSVTGPGSQIGQFRIERELGRGAVGVVYLAHDTKLDRPVAIKSLPAEIMGDRKTRSRFSREARVLASLNHPNIATIHEELEEAEGVVHLILEYVPGQTLAERIAKKPLKLEEALSIALQIAEAVAAAHEHDVIHRDLKPSNIKITPEGKVKVLDFGLAKAVGGEAVDQQSTVTEPGRVIGTPAYMSPEQARGQAAEKSRDSQTLRIHWLPLTMDKTRDFPMNLLFSGRRYLLLFLSVLLISVSTGYCDAKTDGSGNHPVIILKNERIREIRNLAKQDELLQDIIDEIFRMANAELEQPLINYEELIGRPHRTSKEALSGKYVLDIASLSGSRLLLLNTAYRFSQHPRQKYEYKDRILAEIDALVALPDWNPGHFLDIGEISFGLAITYDWMHDELTTDYRKKIETSLLDKAILPGIAAYRRKAKWTYKFNNHTQVINAGLVIAALALNDIYPEPCRQILALAKQVMPKAMKDFYAPNGVYMEGPSYWQYGTTFNILMIDALRTTLNDDWGLLGTEGFQRTGAFQMHCISPTYKYFNFADAPEKARIPPALFWLSKVYEEPSYSGFMEAWLKRIFDKRDPSSKEASVTLSGTLLNKSISRFFPLAAIWYHTYPHTNKNVPTQIVFKENGIAIMRSRWNDERALYLGVKGGENGLSHSHLDLGSFILENDGVRWAIDFGRELYNLPGISQYYAENSKRWDYYRLGTKSHNTLMINGENQNVKGKAEIVGYNSSTSISLVELDLSKAYYGSAKSVKRSIAMVKDRHVVIKDEIAGQKGDEIRWAMATSASITITENTATLASDNKKMYAHIIAPEDAKFMAISTKPENPDEKQNEGTGMLGVYTIAKSTITKILIILTNDSTENLKPLIPMKLLAE